MDHADAELYLETKVLIIDLIDHVRYPNPLLLQLRQVNVRRRHMSGSRVFVAAATELETQCKTWFAQPRKLCAIPDGSNKDCCDVNGPSDSW